MILIKFKSLAKRKKIIVNFIHAVVRSVVVVSVGFMCQGPPIQAEAADANSPLPAVIQSGFALWVKGGGASVALDVWRKGGLIEGDSKVALQSTYFRRIERAVGNYKSYELVQNKRIDSNSQIIYLSMSFERGAVYARFLLYRLDKGWVVQNMDFSTQPEAVMPWLAFEGGKYTE